MFGPNVKTAVQDPSYPVYVDTSVMLGQTGEINKDTMQYSNIVYMPCTPENGFFPDYANHERADVVYICSPKYVPDLKNFFSSFVVSNFNKTRSLGIRYTNGPMFHSLYIK